MMAMAQKPMRHSLEIGGGALLTENYFNVMNHCGGSGSVQYGFGPIEHLDLVARLTVGKGVEGGMRIYDGGDYVSVMNYRTSTIPHIHRAVTINTMTQHIVIIFVIHIRHKLPT